MLDVEVDRARIDAWAWWLTVEVFYFNHIQSKSWVIFKRSRIFVIVG